MSGSKPIVRWTLGNVSNDGIICLKIAIKRFIGIYHDKFDYFLFHNNINNSFFSWVNYLNVKINLYEQKCDKHFLNLSNYNPFWKILTPRLDIGRHEIIIDNDLIIYKKLKEFDIFLDSQDLFLITQGCREKKNGVTYGFFENLIRKDEKINFNTGIIGLPPNYDFNFEINNILEKNNLQDLTFFDEQGMVSYIIQNKNYKIISNKKISFFKNGECGVHLIGVNKEKNKYNFKKYIFM